jgi:hypothetical protein
MPDFHTVEARGDKRLETLSPAAIARVSPDRDCPRRVCDRDRVLDGKFVLWNERAAFGAKVPGKRVAKISHHPTGNHRPRDVRAANRSSVRLLEHFVHRDGNAKLVESVYYSSSARVARDSEIGQPLLQWPELRQVKGEQVNLMFLVVGAQLHSRYHANPGALGSLARGTNAIDGVVIGECEGRQTAALRCRNYALGGECAVRGGRMGMEVDERRPASRGRHRS